MKLQAEATQKYISQSPRKMRLVADMIKKMKVDAAVTQLKFSTKRAADVMGKVINQAKSNAVNNSGVSEGSLKIKTIDIMEGPTYKRWNPVSRGRAHSILKRTSHIKVV